MFPVRSGAAPEIAKVLVERVFLYHGVPRQMTSDNGPQFAGKVMREVCKRLNIKQVFTAVYHPQSNPDERTHRELRFRLAVETAGDHRSWDKHLPAIAASLRDTCSSTTGYSPNELMYGRNVRLPYMVEVEASLPIKECVNWLPQLEESLALAKQRITKAKQANKTTYDKSRRPSESYQPGDRVLVKTHGHSNADKGVFGNWLPRRDGPFEVIALRGPVTVSIGKIGTRDPLKTVHVSDLVPYIEPRSETPVVSPLPEVTERPQRRSERIASRHSPAARAKTTSPAFVTAVHTEFKSPRAHVTKGKCHVARDLQLLSSFSVQSATRAHRRGISSTMQDKKRPSV